MGYYVQITKSDLVIKKHQQDNAYKAMCDINRFDDLKSGGSFSGGKTTEKWFSWMSPNYPETCNDIFEVFGEMGFDVMTNDDGDITAVFYDNKIGDEAAFFVALAPYVEDGSHIDWYGEDGALWRWVFSDGVMQSIEGTTVYDPADATTVSKVQYEWVGDKLESNYIDLNSRINGVVLPA